MWPATPLGHIHTHCRLCNVEECFVLGLARILNWKSSLITRTHWTFLPLPVSTNPSPSPQHLTAETSSLRNQRNFHPKQSKRSKFWIFFIQKGFTNIFVLSCTARFWILKTVTLSLAIIWDLSELAQLPRDPSLDMLKDCRVPKSTEYLGRH